MDFKFGHSLENGTRLLEGKTNFLQHFIILETISETYLRVEIVTFYYINWELSGNIVKITESQDGSSTLSAMLYE